MSSGCSNWLALCVVDGLGTDPHDTALVAAIVALAGALELDVTAEGVETVEQLTEGDVSGI
jgi:EAL domain-containing protein (putative c-di-GMP-specific phosphodiesterase class I)